MAPQASISSPTGGGGAAPSSAAASAAALRGGGGRRASGHGVGLVDSGQISYDVANMPQVEPRLNGDPGGNRAENVIDCRWTLRCSDDTRVPRVIFTAFGTENGHDCASPAPALLTHKPMRIALPWVMSSELLLRRCARLGWYTTRQSTRPSYR